MAALDIFEILDGQDVVFPSAHATLRGGAFRIDFIPKDDHTLAATRPLLFIDGEFELRIERDGGTTYARVLSSAGLCVERALTFPAWSVQTIVRLTFTLDAEAGTLQIEGATTGDGTTTGSPWSAADGALRFGSDESDNYALGWLSKPYGLFTDPPMAY